MRRIRFGLGKRSSSGLKCWLEVGANYVFCSGRTTEWYGFTEKGLKWLKDKGCEWVKIEAEPGDLLLCKFHIPLSSSCSYTSIKLTVV